MKAFDKQYHPPGTAPGTLTERNNDEHDCTVRQWYFNAAEVQETAVQNLELNAQPNAQSVTVKDKISWLDVSGSNDPLEVQQLGQHNNIHPLALEDLLNRGQRPKIDYLDNYVFIILSLPRLVDNEITIEQIGLFADQNKVISFCQGDGKIFDPVRARLRQRTGRVRQSGASYLLYVLIDTVVDAAFPVLETLSDKIDSLEEAILVAPKKSQLHTLHVLKRDLLLLRKTLWPQREVLNRLLRDDSELIDNQHHLYFSDCYDHVIQVIELIETYREMLNGLLDLYLSSLNNRMNDIMRVLTIIATIFIPLTFLVGVYGMNFKHMPELSWPFGYPLLWGIMLVLVGVMLWLFKRNHWL